MMGASVPDRALAVPAEPVSRLGPSGFDPSRFEDTFRGDNRRLLDCTEALLSLDSDGALVPHGVGGHGRTLLSALAKRLARIEDCNDHAIEGDLECKVMSYDHAHLEAVELGFPSLTEALEAIAVAGMDKDGLSQAQSIVGQMRAQLFYYDYLLPGDYVPDPPIRKRWFRWRPAFEITQDMIVWAGTIARARSLMDLKSVEDAIAMEARRGATTGATAEGGDSAGPKDIAQ